MNKVASLGISFFFKKSWVRSAKEVKVQQIFFLSQGGFFFGCGALVNKGVLLGGISSLLSLFFLCHNMVT